MFRGTTVRSFSEKLNALPEVKASGIICRLPSADEWKYACRAGCMGKYGLLADGSEGHLDEMGWYRDNSVDMTHSVGQKKPNAFGLCDMHGNVCVWTSTASDDADGDLRVYCGGCWFYGDGRCVSSDRNGFFSNSSYGFFGFRLASGRTEKQGELLGGKARLCGSPARVSGVKSARSSAV